MTRTVAMTGVSGFIGGHLLDALAKRGRRVRALTRRPDRLPSREGLTVIQGGAEDTERFRELVEGTDAVIHLAGSIKATRRDEFFKVNTEMTDRLLATMREVNPEAHFLFVSSLAAREPSVGPYGESKAAAEAVVAASGLARWSILRPPVVYGPGDEETLRFFRIVAKGWIPHPANDSARVSMIHVSDLVEAILSVVEGQAVEGPLELDDGAARGHSWYELGRVAASVYGRSAKPVAVPRAALWSLGLMNEAIGAVTGKPPMITRAKAREFFHPDWVARSPRLTERHEWRPRISLEKGFEQTIKSYLASNRI